ISTTFFPFRRRITTLFNPKLLRFKLENYEAEIYTPLCYTRNEHEIKVMFAIGVVSYSNLKLH
ncbi:unnamed protein product, partial [Arabidopsis halleri]